MSGANEYAPSIMFDRFASQCQVGVAYPTTLHMVSEHSDSSYSRITTARIL